MHQAHFKGLLIPLILVAQSLTAATVEVDWVDYEKYSDIRNPTSEGRKAYRDRVFNNLESQLRTLAEQLPGDQKLVLSVTDLKLAGKLRGNRVRVDPYVYPPRIQFNYQLTDAAGKTLREGNEDLTGQRSLAPKGHSAKDISFFYEKALLTDWFNKTLMN